MGSTEACKCGGTETFTRPVENHGLVKFCRGCGWSLPGGCSCPACEGTGGAA